MSFPCPNCKRPTLMPPHEVDPEIICSTCLATFVLVETGPGLARPHAKIIEVITDLPELDCLQGILNGKKGGAL